jgi:ribose transport system substrate-binding protein
MALALGGALAWPARQSAQEKIKIGVSYPTPTHAWAAGMNWHAEKAEKRLEELYPDIDLILVNSPDPAPRPAPWRILFRFTRSMHSSCFPSNPSR